MARPFGLHCCLYDLACIDVASTFMEMAMHFIYDWFCD